MKRLHFDAVIVGAGQGGGPLARDMVQAGWRTAVIERAHAGGTCVNVGCTPTKTLIASGRIAHLVRRASDYGVRAEELRIDMSAVRQRKRDIVEGFRGGSERRLTGSGVELLRGEAHFTGPRTLSVAQPDGRSLVVTADRIVINTGERPARPAIPGIDRVATLDSTSIMELEEVPLHLLVIGGGYIGLEFGQLFRRLGSAVTIVQRSPRLLGREDPDVADAVADILREDGIELMLGSAPLAVESTPGGVLLRVRTARGEEHEIRGSHLLVAAGRTPNTDVLDPGAAGVRTDARGYVMVNERLETSAGNVWAIGDVKGPPAFTHISYDDYRVLRTNLLHGGDASIADRLVPYTVFIDPQLGRVGMTEQEARRQQQPVLVARMPMSHVARALEVDESRGFMKAIVHADSGRLLGAAVLGLEGGEIASMLQIAMMGGLHYSALRDAVFSHPTLAESLNNLFLNLEPARADVADASMPASEKASRQRAGAAT